jgi:hypothetical protein
MIEEEKLAGNVYRVFGGLYPTIKPFQNIPKSEDTHMAALAGRRGPDWQRCPSVPTLRLSQPT